MFRHICSNLGSTEQGAGSSKRRAFRLSVIRSRLSGGQKGAEFTDQWPQDAASGGYRLSDYEHEQEQEQSAINFPWFQYFKAQNRRFSRHVSSFSCKTCWNTRRHRRSKHKSSKRSKCLRLSPEHNPMIISHLRF
jgi:hypothetical protein